MRSSIPLWLFATLGLLTAAGGADAADPSQWKCENCPFEDEGVHGTVDAGIGTVSKDSNRFGDYTGLDRKGAFAVLDGAVRYRGKDGVYGGLVASDLGLDVRSLAAEHGREGLYRVRLGYAELPHLVTEGARTPFLGVGGPLLTLPAGFPAPTTADMPLAATLQPVDIGFEHRRLDVGGSLLQGAQWEYRLDARRDERDGTQRSAGSFFNTASQLVAPVDHVTDRIDASASFTGRRLQATLSYHASLFRQGQAALTWQNPFMPVVAGADSGQLALAPDNEFHQLAASVGYRVSPTLRFSGDVALGRMTQDEAYLAATLNPTLLVTVPATSLHGRVETLDANVQASFDATERLRLAASYVRNERDNQTPVAAYTMVATDMFIGGTLINTPYSFERDRLKAEASWRGLPLGLKLAAGAEHDALQRTNQETEETREGTVWLRAGLKPLKNLALSAKAWHAERDHTGYATLATVQPPENPLLRKYHQADRRRDAGALRADLSVGENVSIGLSADFAADDYTDSPVGLTESRSGNLGADLSVAVSDDTRVRVFGQAERIRSRQAGSQQFGAADWTGRVKDTVEMLGVGLTHVALKGKLELGADLSITRGRSEVSVDVGASGGPYPPVKSALDSLKLHATYKLKDNVSLIGSWWNERYDADDWRLDGVQPASVPNLVAFGELAPAYRVNVVRLAVRYGF